MTALSQWLITLIVPNTENALVLAGYTLLLALCIRIALRYRRQALQQLSRPISEKPSLSQDEWAFLCGGTPRMMQLAIFSLYQCQLLKTENRMFSQVCLPVETLDFDANRLTKWQQLLYARSCAKGKLVAMDEPRLRALGMPYIQAMEAKLALAGLRPTSTEYRTMVLRTMLPFLLLCALGVARILYGVAHDHPVLYLVILVILTLICGGIIANTIDKITISGKEMLADQRRQLDSLLLRPGTGLARERTAALAVMLMGASGLASFPEFRNFQALLQSQSAGHSSSSSSSGCGSSGCGSSGCGSSGCGGGCGGD